MKFPNTLLAGSGFSALSASGLAAMTGIFQMSVILLLARWLFIQHLQSLTQPSLIIKTPLVHHQLLVIILEEKTMRKRKAQLL